MKLQICCQKWWCVLHIRRISPQPNLDFLSFDTSELQTLRRDDLVVW
nr:MAG TPA: hypothetical protein [Caudoviricetes sp.]